MIDLFQDLTWQLQVLCAETVFSGLIAIVLLARGFQRSLVTMTFFLAWNAVLFWLLFTGTNDASWQHVTLAGWYLLDSASCIWAGVTRKRTGPDEHGCLGVAFVVVMTMFVLYLIIAG